MANLLKSNGTVCLTYTPAGTTKTTRTQRRLAHELWVWDFMLKVNGYLGTVAGR